MHRKACLHVNSHDHDSCHVPYLPGKVKCSTHPGYPQLPSHQKHQYRADNEDNTFQHHSNIIFSALFTDFLIKKTVYLPTWLPPVIIPLTLHILCKGKEAWLCKHGMAVFQSRIPTTQNAFDSLWVLVKHIILSSQRNLKWLQLLIPKCETQLHLSTLHSLCSVLQPVLSLVEG